MGGQAFTLSDRDRPERAPGGWGGQKEMLQREGETENDVSVIDDALEQIAGAKKKKKKTGDKNFMMLKAYSAVVDKNPLEVY